VPVETQSVYALILGGGQGLRLFPLTKDRSKPAVPLAGKYRLIDVPISNCINSRMCKIFVLTQFNSESLHRHIHHVYKFDIFSEDFVELLAAEQTQGQLDWYQGTADAVRRNLWHLTDPRLDRVLILSGDQLYRMDYQQVLRTHEERHAEVTLAATTRHPDDAEGFGVLKIDNNYRVVDFIEKPDRAAMRNLVVQGEELAPLGVQATGPVVLVSMGIYLFDRSLLALALENDMADFGKNVIPWCIQHLKVFVHPFNGYWEDVGTIRSFFDANLDLTADEPKFNLYESERPIYTHPRFLPNSKIETSTLDHVLLSEGCLIDRAIIENAVIGVRSVIQRGSVLQDVIMMGQDSYESAREKAEHVGQPARGVGAECRIARAILDKNARIGQGVTITSHLDKPNEDGDCYYVRDGIVIIPKNVVVPAGTII